MADVVTYKIADLSQTVVESHAPTPIIAKERNATLCISSENNNTQHCHISDKNPVSDWLKRC